MDKRKIIEEIYLFTTYSSRIDKLKESIDTNIHNENILQNLEILIKISKKQELSNNEIESISDKKDNFSEFLLLYYTFNKQGFFQNPNNNVWKLFFNAIFYFENNYKKAFDLLKKILEIDPQFLPALFFYGIKRNEYKQCKIAAEYLTKFYTLITFNLLKQKSGIHLSRLNLFCNKYDEAIKYAELAEQHIHSSLSLYNLSFIHYSLKDIITAEKYLFESVNLYESNRNLNMLGWYYFDRLDYKKAEIYFKKIIDKKTSSFLPIFRFYEIMNNKDLLNMYIKLSIEKQGYNFINEAFYIFTAKDINERRLLKEKYLKKYGIYNWFEEETEFLLLNKKRIFRIKNNYEWPWYFEMYIRDRI